MGTDYYSGHYKCNEDCNYTTGCPSHLLKMTHFRTSDLIELQRDGKHIVTEDYHFWQVVKGFLNELEWLKEVKY